MKIKERLITLHDLFAVLRRYILLLLACAVLGGLFGALYGNVGRTTTWSASGSVYVNAADASLGTGLNATDISMGRALARNCGEVLVSDALIGNVRRYFDARRADRPDEGWEDLSGYSTAALKGMFSVEVPDNSQQVVIRVSGAPTPSLACHLVNAAIGEAEVSVAPLLGALRMTPVSTAGSASPVGGAAISIRRTVVFAAAFAVLAYAVLYLAFYCSPRVQTGRELSHSFGDILPLYGVLPSDGAAEEIHAARAELLAACGETPCPVIGLAPVGAAGETGAAAQALAASFASAGRRALLIDADFRGDAIPAPDGTPGLTAALNGETAAPSSAGDGAFDLLPRGEGTDAVASLLGAPVFARAMETYRADYDVILVRLPDAARYADAGAAAPALSGVLLPVALRRTRRDALTLALERLRGAGATLFGLLAFSPEKRSGRR